MSDDQEKKFTNYDLDLAEQKIIAAGGTPEYADALYSYFQGWRNYTQGQFGQQFVDAYEQTLTRHITPIRESEATTERILGQVVQRLDQQLGLVQQLVDMQKTSEKHAKQALAVARETTRGLKKLNTEVVALRSAMAESKEDRADLRARIIRLEAQIEHLKQAAGDVQPE